MKKLIATICLATICLTASAADTNTVTVTVTLTPEQSAFLAGNAKTNLPAIKAEAAQAFAEAANRRINTASAEDEKLAVKLFRNLTDAQKKTAIGILSGRPLTPEEKAIVQAIAAKVLAD